MRTPAAWKNSPRAFASGALPEMKKRRRPPKRAWSLLKTSLCAILCLRARRPDGSFPASRRRETSRPTPTAHEKIAHFAPPASFAPPDHAAAAARLLREWGEACGRPVQLLDLPAVLPDELFADRFHLNEEGRRVYSAAVGGGGR